MNNRLQIPIHGDMVALAICTIAPRIPIRSDAAEISI
jgi:hypothetical protein